MKTDQSEQQLCLLEALPGSREEEEQGGGDVLACTVVCLVGEEKCQVSLCLNERNLFLFPCSTLAVLVTVREQLRQQKCRTAGFLAWPSSTVPAAGTGGDRAQSNTKLEGAQRHATALLLQEGTGDVSTRWHGRTRDAQRGPGITLDGSWTRQWAERGCH